MDYGETSGVSGGEFRLILVRFRQKVSKIFKNLSKNLENLTKIWLMLWAEVAKGVWEGNKIFAAGGCKLGGNMV